MPTVYNDPIMLDSTGQDIVTKLDNIATLMGDGVIDDTSTSATDKTWSASKENTIVNELKDNITANTKLIKDTVGWSGKNKLPSSKYCIQFDTSDGNDGKLRENLDGSITFYDVTNESIIRRFFNTIKAGKYKFSLGKNPTATWVLFANTTKTTAGNPKQICVITSSQSEVEFTLSTEDVNTYPYMFLNQHAATGDTNTYYPMIYDADILDSTYEPYFGSTAFPRSEQAVLGAKNLIDLSSQPNRTNAGVTCEIINKNQFSLTGATTGSGAVPFANESGNLKLNTIQGKQYRIIAQVLSGSFTVGTGSNTIYVRKPTTNQYYANFVMPNNKTYSAGDVIFNQTFVADSNNAVSYGAQLWMENITFNDCVIGWSMQLATDEDTSFIPYAMTNKELTDSVMPVDITSEFMTLAEGISLGSDVSVVKIGNLIVGNLVFKKTGNFTQGQTISIATVDSKYRPKKNLNSVCHFTTSEWDGSQPIGGYFWVGTNGSLNIRQYSETAQIACKMSFSYAIS